MDLKAILVYIINNIYSILTFIVIRNTADTLGVVPGMSLAQLQQLCSKAKSAFGNSVPSWDTSSVRTAGVALGIRQ